MMYINKDTQVIVRKGQKVTIEAMYVASVGKPDKNSITGEKAIKLLEDDAKKGIDAKQEGGWEITGHAPIYGSAMTGESAPLVALSDVAEMIKSELLSDKEPKGVELRKNRSS